MSDDKLGLDLKVCRGISLEMPRRGDSAGMTQYEIKEKRHDHELSLDVPFLSGRPMV